MEQGANLLCLWLLALKTDFKKCLFLIWKDFTVEFGVTFFPHTKNIVCLEIVKLVVRGRKRVHFEIILSL